MQLWVMGKEMTPRKLLMILMTGNWGSFTMLLGIIGKGGSRMLKSSALID